MSNNKSKIAVVHDHLGFSGGGERTALLMALDLGADFITAYHNPHAFPGYQNQLGNKLISLSQKIIHLRVVRFFWLRGLFWLHRQKLNQYDILIASGQTATEVVAKYAAPQALKIVYTHSTPRRVFDLYETSKAMYPLILRPFYTLFAHYWKYKYLNLIPRFDINIANSKIVAQRIKAHTKGNANYIVWPPILTSEFTWIEQGDYFLSWGRVDEAKRIELIVEAFAKMPDKKLIIASSGPREKQVRAIAKDYHNIQVLGWVSDDKLKKLVGTCRAAIYIPINEDAGMTHLEANAAGKPVLAVREGGLIETVRDQETGLLLNANPNTSEICEAIRRMTAKWCIARQEQCIQHAKNFSEKHFFQKINKIIQQNHPAMPVFGIDASRWEDPRFPGKHIRTGVENYSYHLILALIPQIQAKGMRVKLYTPRFIQSLPAHIQKVIPGKKHWTHKHLARELKHSPPDYFLCPGFLIPKTAPPKSCAVIHDIVFKTHPQKYSFWGKIKLNYVTKKNIQRSHKIITISKNSQAEILKNYNLNSQKIIVAPLGYTPQKKSTILSNITQTKRQKHHILYIGRIEKKKSLDILIQAFAKLYAQNKAWQLTLAGQPGYGYTDIQKLINQLNLEKIINLPGYISEEEKHKLLSNASILIQPNPDEGSCLPLFEAWDFKVPAILPDVPLMQELAQNGALFFSHNNTQDLINKILKLQNNLELRKKLKKIGEQNLKKITWAKTGEKILKTAFK